MDTTAESGDRSVDRTDDRPDAGVGDGAGPDAGVGDGAGSSAAARNNSRPRRVEPIRLKGFDAAALAPQT